MNFEENFQNVSDYDGIDLDKELFYNTENDVKEEFDDHDEVKEEFDDHVKEEFDDHIKEEFDDKKEQVIEEESNDNNNIFNTALNAKFSKSSSVKGVEGFNGGSKKKYDDSKLILKSILFGLLFYLLSNQKIYNITKPYLNGLDKNLVHSIVFIILFYLINIVI